MIQGIKDYARCSYHNIVIRSAYAIGTAAAATFIPTLNDQIGLVITSIPLIGEHFDEIRLAVIGVSIGVIASNSIDDPTFRAYRTVRRHFDEGKPMNSAQLERYGNTYCSRVGVKMAHEERGLEYHTDR